MNNSVNQENDNRLGNVVSDEEAIVEAVDLVNKMDVSVEDCVVDVVETEESLRKVKLEKLMTTRDKLANEKNNLHQRLYMIQEEIKKNNEEIYVTCKHNWIRDPFYSPAPYEKPDDVCTICNSINYRW